MRRPPIISIIILNYQTYSDTISFINQIKIQEDVDIKILIVDNCSLNNSFNILLETYENDSQVEVIRSERNGGYAYGNNFGLRHIENKVTDFILISNNDVIIKDKYLLSHLTESYLQCESPAYLSPVMLNEKEEKKRLASWNIPTFFEDFTNLVFLDRINRFNKETKKGPTKGCIAVECLPGSFTLIKKEIVYILGLFDEGTFLYCEERINAVKVKRKGLHNYLNQELFFLHKEAETVSQAFSYISRMKILVNSRIYFHAKYNKLPKYIANSLWLGFFINIIIYVFYRILKR